MQSTEYLITMHSMFKSSVSYVQVLSVICRGKDPTGAGGLELPHKLWWLLQGPWPWSSFYQSFASGLLLHIVWGWFIGQARFDDRKLTAYNTCKILDDTKVHLQDVGDRIECQWLSRWLWVAHIVHRLLWIACMVRWLLDSWISQISHLISA